MPKQLIKSMKRGGVRSPYGLLNAAGYDEGDSEREAKSKLSRYQKRVHRRKMKGSDAAEALARR